MRWCRYAEGERLMRHAYPQYAARLDNAKEPKTTSQLVSLQPESHFHYSKLACGGRVVPAHCCACKVCATTSVCHTLLHVGFFSKAWCASFYIVSAICLPTSIASFWHETHQLFASIF